MVGALDERLPLGELDDQLHRVHPGVGRELVEELARRVLLELDEPVAAGELRELLGGGRLRERDEDAVGDQELLARVGDPVGVVRRGELAGTAHRRLEIRPADGDA